MAWGTLRNTVLQVWAEVLQTLPFVLFLLGFIVSWIVAVMLSDDGATRVRYFGTVLQLLGIALVAKGLSELRREFNRPGVFAAMWARIVAIVGSFKPRRYPIQAVGGAFISSGSLVALGHGRVTGTIEQRLDGLEREIDDIRKQAEERERRIMREIGEVRTALSNETQERKNANAEISSRLDSFAVGGLHLEVIGLWWLLVATVATSIPEEIAAWF